MIALSFHSKLCEASVSVEICWIPVLAVISTRSYMPVLVSDLLLSLKPTIIISKCSAL